VRDDDDEDEEESAAGAEDVCWSSGAPEDGDDEELERLRLRGASVHSEALPLATHRPHGRVLLHAFLAFLHCMQACGTRRCAKNQPWRRAA